MNGNLERLGIPDGTDLGFRFRNGECINSRAEKGLNPDCLGICGDLRNIRFDKLKNLQFQVLNGADFSGNSVRDVNLYAAKLYGARFVSTDLSGAWMEAAIISHADFTNAILKKAVFFAANGSYANFSGADMTEVWWAESMFTHADFSGADMRSPWKILEMNNCFPPKCWGGAIYDRKTQLPFSDEIATKVYGFVFRERN